jgi:SNF2 family DNA or RNA helicase
MTDAQDQTIMEGKEDIAWFYGQIKKYHREEILPDVPFEEEGSLIPILRDYQKDAVKWMLCRERGFINKTNLTELFINKMFIPIELKSTLPSVTTDESDDCVEVKTVFYSPFFGTFAWCIPTLTGMPSGGILCDEMGKTNLTKILYYE